VTSEPGGRPNGRLAGKIAIVTGQSVSVSVASR
jgi:hypothetical protein